MVDAFEAETLGSFSGAVLRAGLLVALPGRFVTLLGNEEGGRRRNRRWGRRTPAMPSEA